MIIKKLYNPSHIINMNIKIGTLIRQCERRCNKGRMRKVGSLLTFWPLYIIVFQHFGNELDYSTSKFYFMNHFCIESCPQYHLS